jgi:hypothetical protein
VSVPRPFLARASYAALLACAVLAPLAVHWVAGRTLVWFDTMALYAPERWLVDEALRAFRLPLWNPFSGAGHPLFADAIHGVLHPVSILTAWLGTDRGADALIGGYVACAGLGGAVLARELGATRAGAVVAAVAYGASGYVLSMAGNLVFLAGAGSLPFLVAGLRRFAVEPRGPGLAFAVGGTAVAALAGDVQAVVVGGALALALAWDGAGWRGAARAVGAGTVGLLVAGVQLYPTAVHVPRTVREAGLWITNPAEWAFEPWRLQELILPPFGGQEPYLDRVFQAVSSSAAPANGGHPFPFAASVTVGLLPLALAAAGAREGRRGRLLGVLALALLWIAFGPRLGAANLLGGLPVWSAFRYAEKLVGPMTLVLGVLAGLGLDAVVARRVSGQWLVAIAASLGIASLVALRAVGAGLPADTAAIADARFARASWHAAAALVALVSWLLARDRLGGRAARVLAGLAWVAAFAASPAALRPGDPELRLRSGGPALEAAPPGPRVVPPDATAVGPRLPGGDRIGEAARDFAAVWSPAFNVRDRVDSLAEYAAMAPQRLATLTTYLAGDRWPVVARRYAATHLFLAPYLAEDDPGRFAELTSGGARVAAPPGGNELWAVPHRPWASFAPEVRVVAELGAATRETGRAIAEGSDAVVVEAASAFRAAPGRVISLRRGLESVRIEAEAAEEATLVIADAWWPGWEATIDGLPAPIRPADVLVRAVRWPAGRHVLEMRYRPPEVRAGLWLSAIGLLLTGGGCILLGRGRLTPAERPGDPLPRPALPLAEAGATGEARPDPLAR